MASQHVWKFFRAGGVDQVLLERGSDIENLRDLDLKLWIAVAMPVKGVDLDPKTARFLDTDADERIRAEDILTTVDWLKERMTSLDCFVAGSDKMKLSDIKKEALRATAERISKDIAKDGVDKNGATLTVKQIDAADKKFTESAFNGDAIITEKTPSDEAVSAVVKEIIATLGSIPDRCGQPGIDADKVKAFFTDAKALSDWKDAGSDASVTRPLGDATEAAAALVRKLTPKLDDYFTRCRLLAFDEKSAASGQVGDADVANLSGKVLAASSPELLKLPLAKIVAGQPLPFEDGSNPAYAADLLALRHDVAKPLLGTSSNTLSESDYRAIQSKLASFEAWVARKPSTKLDALPMDRVQSLAKGEMRSKLDDLIERDAGQKGELDNILEVEKLLYLHRDFVRILRNFVSFTDFYGKRSAIFQTGTLYLDGRGCELCIDVADPSKHATLASLASTYLAYCDIKRKGEPNRTIVAAFTAGDSDNLMVGRNGLFIDRAGKDWDATITKTVENPISIRQAFFSPYKKFVRLVEEQVAKRASDADAEAQARVASAAESTANADRAVAAPPAAAAPPRKTIDVGTVAAIGVAIGGIGGMFTGLLAAFFGLGIFMPFGILAIVMLISGPAMVLAWLKLRRRNLGPLLDASGWAVNGLANVNVPFGGALTDLATLPKNSTRTMTDPYAEKKSPVRLYVLLAVLLAITGCWMAGKFDRFLPRRFKSTHVLPVERAPAATPPAAAP